MKKVYVDNASGSFPKAPGVSDAIKGYLDTRGYNVNRGGYAGSYSLAMELYEAREAVAALFGAASPKEVIFTPGATHSLNMILLGYLQEGDHVLCTSMEHNAVMRPLFALSQKGVAYDIIPCRRDGTLSVKDIAPFIKRETKALVMLHASNVCGSLMPIYEAAELCRGRGVRLIVDAAQTAGVLDISAKDIDALVFTGHKGLLGPGGIGGFVVKEDFAEEIRPIITGGTGSLSHELSQPDFLPDKFEAGTPNISGIIGLKHAIEYICKTGHSKEMALLARFLDGVRGIEGVKVIGKSSVAIASLDFPGRDNGQIAADLDTNYGIMTRCGLHCAPTAHKTLGTYPGGTVRFSFGHFNTQSEVDYILRSIKEL